MRDIRNLPRLGASFLVIHGTLLLAACGDGLRTGAAPTVRDSAGITIIENTAPSWRSGREWRLAPEPLLSIGAVEGAREYQFNGADPVLRLSDGRIVVANVGSGEIRYFDAIGSFLGAVGGPGDGPEDFRTLGWIGRLPADSLLVHDLHHQRLTRIDPQGAIVGSSTLESTERGLRIRGRFDDGTLLAQALGLRLLDGGPAPAATNSVRRSPIRLLRIQSDGLTINPVTTLRGAETCMVQAGNGRFAISPPPFGRTSLQAARGGRVFAADNDTYQIEILTPDGTRQRIIRRLGAEAPVTQEAVASVRARRLEGIVDPTERRAREQVLHELPLPSIMPAFDAFVPDDVANLWVREYALPEAVTRIWTVFDADGRMLGSLPISAQFTPRHIGEDFVLGVWRDDLDVEHVRLYALEKP